MNIIIIDGIEYELIRKVPKPKFKVNDAIQYIHEDGTKSKNIHRISHLISDRYYLDGGDEYVQFVNQDNYELIGVFKFEFLEKG